MTSVRLNPSAALTPARIDEILSRGDRDELEQLMLRILREPAVVDHVEALYSSRMSTAAEDPEFTASVAYEAVHWLAQLSRVLPHRPRPSEQLAKYHDQVAAIIEKYKGRNPRVFGSVRDGTDTADSDLDLLVDNAGGMTLIDLAGMVRELQDLLGIEVDVITEGGLRGAMRDRVLAAARPL